MTLKFKNRIALFNSIAVALTTALVFVVIYTVVKKTAYDHLDRDILLEKEEVFSNLFWRNDSIIINKMPEWDEAEHSKVEVNPTFLQIVDNKGNVVFHSTNLLEDVFLFDPHNTNETFFNSELSNQKIRLGQFPVKNDVGKNIGQLTIAISQQESFVILNNLLLVLLVAFPLMLIVQFVASSWAASKAIAPVNQLIETASGISDFNVGTRLVLPVRRDELYELTQTINDLLARIEASIHQQRQFTSDASHEIRTPLAAIRGTLEVLIRKHREPKFYEEKIYSVISQVDRLNALLDQLLQFSRIESGIATAKKEYVKIDQTIYSLQDKWREDAIRRKIALHLQIPPDSTVVADSFYLELILDNLVNNAIKYSNEGGNVFLVWNKDKKTLKVQDDGIGISEADLPRIFDRFFRVDESRSSLIKGNGLGLSIVKKLAEVQDITLLVESKAGLGSSFTLQFPF